MVLLTSDLLGPPKLGEGGCPPTAEKRYRAAFTLVELMTVIAIIAMLAGMILGVAGYATRKADQSRAIADMEKIKGALEEYRVDKGAYPADMSNLTNYRHDLKFVDPWGKDYQYLKTGKFQYQIWSTGPDPLDSSDDIRNW